MGLACTPVFVVFVVAGAAVVVVVVVVVLVRPAVKLLVGGLPPSAKFSLKSGLTLAYDVWQRAYSTRKHRIHKGTNAQSSANPSTAARTVPVVQSPAVLNPIVVASAIRYIYTQYNYYDHLGYILIVHSRHYNVSSSQNFQFIQLGEDNTNHSTIYYRKHNYM